jgi:DNA-binding LacI/PurR family transcriptional regulator
MSTIADVAKLAGISQATVSRVINNYPYVSEEKRRLVYEAMERLGYSPNTSAQRLRKQKTDIIAVLVPRLTNPFFAHLVEGLEEVATKQGLQLLICQTKYDESRELEYLNLLKTKQVDGLILTSIENNWKDIEPITEHGPVVLCNEYVNDYDATVPMIRLNQFQGGYIGTRHLIEKGHTQIAYCSGGKMSGIAYDRKKGFELALKEQGLKLDVNWFFTDVFDIEDGMRVMQEIVRMNHRPTAIFTGSDEVAAGIVSEAKKHGFNVPVDFAVIGFDDQPIARLVWPNLTTIRQPVEAIGEIAMCTMIAILRSENYQRFLMKPLTLELVIGGTS